jgi:nicotinamidase-related amidase
LTKNCLVQLCAKARKSSLRITPVFRMMEETRLHYTTLHSTLQAWGIERVIIYGIARDYCVRASALDAVALGYQVVMVKGLSRGVALETTNHAFEEMKQRGVIVLDTLSKKEFK